MCVYSYGCVCVCIYSYGCVCVCIYCYVCVCFCVCLCVGVCVCVPPIINVYVCVLLSTFVRTLMSQFVGKETSLFYIIEHPLYIAAFSYNLHTLNVLITLIHAVTMAISRFTVSGNSLNTRLV